MMGHHSDIHDEFLRGIIPRTVFEIFNRIYNSPTNNHFYIRIGMLQLYNGGVGDLIDVNKDNLEIRENNKLGI
jgi:hypothetical protein